MQLYFYLYFLFGFLNASVIYCIKFLYSFMCCTSNLQINKGVKMDIGLKLTESEFYTLIDWIKVSFHSKMEHEVFKKDFSWKRAYVLAGVEGFENSRNCSDACSIYQFCNIDHEISFRALINYGIYDYKIAISNNTNILTGELKKPEYKVRYDDLKSILDKLDSYIEWYKKTYPEDTLLMDGIMFNGQKSREEHSKI